MKYNKNKDINMPKADDNKWWCNVIKKLRREQKVTLLELSLRTNITSSYLSRIENGHSIPTISKLQVILSGLHHQIEIVPIEDVMF